MIGTINFKTPLNNSKIYKNFYIDDVISYNGITEFRCIAQKTGTRMQLVFDGTTLLSVFKLHDVFREPMVRCQLNFIEDIESFKMSNDICKKLGIYLDNLVIMEKNLKKW